MDDAPQRNAAAASQQAPACDVVMKGGVTSGVIYPRFLARLASVYRLKNLGGSSAGAIAAAGAAVAQLASYRGLPDSFARLEALPATLAQAHERGGSRMLNLFQPQAAGRKSFRVGAALLDGGLGGRWISRLLAALLAEFWPAALAGAIPGALIVAAALTAMSASGSSSLQGLALVIGVVFGVVFALVGMLLWALRSAVLALAGNHFGLCTGMPNEGERRDALTVWLHDYYNSLLGVGPKQAPVTFGELWAGKGNGSPAKRAIDLQVITTALNLKRPFRIPNDPGADQMRVFFYDPDEWKLFFPDEVLHALQANPRPSRFAGRLFSRRGTPLLPLPEAQHWPVIVAVRMSLSFPLLLSAVPLYMVDWTLKANQLADQTEGARFEPSKVYFSDGGIASNFPIHLFDAPLPRHPTFGLNLRPLHPEASDAERVWRPAGNDEGMVQHAPQFPDQAGWKPVAKFLISIVTTMQSWRDTMQQTMPGYRDRIVHISQRKNEGGLNLAMDPKIIGSLAELGEDAADRLITDFATPCSSGEPNAWDNHRWLRMRSSLCTLNRYLGRFDESAGQGAPPYRTLPGGTPPSYPFIDRDASRHAAEFMAEIAKLMDKHRDSADDLCNKAPRPAPSLRNTPSW